MLQVGLESGHVTLTQSSRSESARCKVCQCWPLVAQFSSIGSLGSNPQQWLTGEFLSSLSALPAHPTTCARAAERGARECSTKRSPLRLVRCALVFTVQFFTARLCNASSDVRRCFRQWRTFATASRATRPAARSRTRRPPTPSSSGCEASCSANMQ